LQPTALNSPCQAALPVVTQYNSTILSVIDHRHRSACIVHAGKKQAVVAGVVEGSAAEQRRKVAGLNRSLLKESVQDGVCREQLYTQCVDLGLVRRTRFMYQQRLQKSGFLCTQLQTCCQRRYKADSGAGLCLAAFAPNIHAEPADSIAACR
jgi:hypothetical protein